MAAKKEETVDGKPLEAVEQTAVSDEEKAKKIKAKAESSEKAMKIETAKDEMPRANAPLSFFHGPVLLGIALLFLGIVLLGGELLGFRFGSILWPFIFIIPGAVLFLSTLSSTDSHAEGVAILGSMMVALGIIFLLQQVLDMWASWAYAWALLAPTSIGVAQVIFGKQHNRDSLVKNGKGLIEVGLTLFFVFFVFFELILNISGKNFIPFGLPAFPVALIVLGIFVIARSLLRKK